MYKFYECKKTNKNTANGKMVCRKMAKLKIYKNIFISFYIDVNNLYDGQDVNC